MPGAVLRAGNPRMKTWFLPLQSFQSRRGGHTWHENACNVTSALTKVAGNCRFRKKKKQSILPRMFRKDFREMITFAWGLKNRWPRLLLFKGWSVPAASASRNTESGATLQT